MHFSFIFSHFLDSNEALWCCSWNGNGKLLASAGSDKKIRLYQVSEDSLIPLRVLQSGHQKSIRSLSFAPRRNQLAAASFDGTVSIWSGKGDWNCTATVEGHENEVKAAAWASFIDEIEGEEQRFLATCGRDKTVWVWAVEESLHDPSDEDYECLAVLQEHEQDIKCLTWHPRIPLFLTGSYDESVRVWGPTGPSLDDWVPMGELLMNAGGTIWSLAFDADGKKLAVALSTGQLIIYTLPDNWNSFKDWQRVDFELFEPVKITEKSDCCKSNEGDCGSSSCCSTDKSASCCSTEKDNGCCSTEKDSGCCSTEKDTSMSSGCCNSENNAESECCSSSPPASQEESGCCGDSSSPQTGSCCSQPKKASAKPTIPAAELFSASWSLNGQFLVLATAARSILLFDSAQGRIVVEVKGAHDEDINCVSWNPQSFDTFASCSDDGTLKIWKIK